MTDNKVATHRKHVFSSRLSYVMVAAGAAIGLGNIWRFPYLVYKDGGCIFIIVYIIVTFIIGKTGIEIETAIGRYSKTNPVDCYTKINKKSSIIGWIGILFTIMLDMYYIVVGGYVLKYSANYLFNIDFGNGLEFYNNYISNPVLPLVFSFLLLFLTAFFLAKGITRKVEQITKYIMPLLLMLLIVCIAITLITIPSSVEGLKYLLLPDFSKFSFTVISDACVQSMFSIGTGWCLYVMLGSNVDDSENIKKTATYIVICDTLIAILASFVVIPTVVGSHIEMTAGPSLIFIAMVDIFKKIPLGRLFGFLFFFILFLAVLTSMFSFIEIPASVLKDRTKIKHSKAVYLTSLLIFILSITCSWSQGNNILSSLLIPWINFKSVNYYQIIDWVDCFSSYILLPIGNICISIFCYKIWGFSSYSKELFLNDQNRRLKQFDKLIIKYGIPLLSIISLLNVFSVL